MRVLLLVLVLFFAPLVAALEVTVSIVPQRYILKQIAGDRIKVHVMVPPGASPATYEPKPSQMRNLANSRIYFFVGVPFEKAWLPRFRRQNPDMTVVNMTEGIVKVPMESHAHDHKKHKHGHESVDPHVWLSPPLVEKMARNAVRTLVHIDPAHADDYQRALVRFIKKVRKLDDRLEKILAPCRGRTLMVFHPSWGYFARRYGLRQWAIEKEGKSPKSKALLRLIKEAKKMGVTTIFVQPQFNERTAKVIASQIGARVVTADPMAYDWDRNLLNVAKQIAGTCP